MTAAAPSFHLAGNVRPPAVPWRALGLLAAGVLVVHAIVLSTGPARFGVTPDTSARQTQAFTTRSIQPPPVQAAAPGAPPAAPPRPVVRKRAPRAPAPAAVSSPAPDTASIPAPPTESAAGPENAAAAVTAAAAPTPPASSPAAPPPGPQYTPVTAMALPDSAQLTYEMTGSSKGLTYQAKALLEWNNAGASYDARMTVSALFLGSRSMASTGQVSAIGLNPTRFSDKSRSEVAAHFEPEKGQISFSANTPSVAWMQGAQDRVSVFFQLGGMLAGNPAAFPVGSTITLFTVGPRDADTWTFAVEAEEMMRLPAGELPVIKLSRQPRREFDQKVEIWYAPSLGYLPVRNKITQHNGDYVDQQLKALSRS